MAAKTVQPDHSGTRGVRRVARGFIDRAGRGLVRPGLSDQQVHDARKNLQRSRAALRMLRPALGERVYRRENTRLRDAARALNSARDARVLAGTLDALCANGSALERDRAAGELSHELHAEQAQVQRALSDGRTLDLPRAAIERVARHSRHWRIDKGGWSMLGPAFKRVYKTARQCVPASGMRPSDAALHEWRKRTKYVRYALQMLEPIRPSMLGPLVREARSLSECLGEHHDLSLLALKAREFAGRDHRNVAALLAAIEQRQGRLLARASAIGAQLYRAKPADLNARLGRYWHSWRRARTLH